MITIKSARELETMAEAGRIVGETLRLMREIVKPGLTTEDLDAAAESFIRSHQGATPSFKGLYGFPKTLCISVDEEIVHGIPSSRRVLAEGSIVSVDCGVHFGGLRGDAATTVPVGRGSAAAERLMGGTAESSEAGRAGARGGSRAGERGQAGQPAAGGAAGTAAGRRGDHVGDIGQAVQTVAEGAGYGVVKELVGHGIGTRFHEDPQVPNYGMPRRGPQLRSGMTIAIEPMITEG